MRSINGIDWQAITDTQGELLVVDRFAVDKSMVYGLSGQKVYQLNQTGNSGTWQQVAPEITHSVSTFESGWEYGLHWNTRTRRVSLYT